MRNRMQTRDVMDVVNRLFNTPVLPASMRVDTVMPEARAYIQTYLGTRVVELRAVDATPDGKLMRAYMLANRRVPGRTGFLSRSLQTRGSQLAFIGVLGLLQVVKPTDLMNTYDNQHVPNQVEMLTEIKASFPDDVITNADIREAMAYAQRLQLLKQHRENAQMWYATGLVHDYLDATLGRFQPDEIADLVARDENTPTKSLATQVEEAEYRRQLLLSPKESIADQSALYSNNHPRVDVLAPIVADLERPTFVSKQLVFVGSAADTAKSMLYRLFGSYVASVLSVRHEKDIEMTLSDLMTGLLAVYHEAPQNYRWRNSDVTAQDIRAFITADLDANDFVRVAGDTVFILNNAYALQNEMTDVEENN